MKPSTATRIDSPRSLGREGSLKISPLPLGREGSLKNSPLPLGRADSLKNSPLPLGGTGPLKISPLPLGGEGPGERGYPTPQTQHPRWLAVHTKARQEHAAKQHLERQGFQVLLPEVRERKRKGRRLQWQTAPMFPRYLFVRTNPERQSIAPIRSTRGCVGPVRIGMHPAWVPPAVIDELRRRTDEPPDIDPTARWQEGQPLQITDGPLRGLTALFQARDGEARAFVLLELLGHWQRANIPLQVLDEAH